MIVSYKWLQTYFGKPLPRPEKLAEALTFHTFEVEGIHTAGTDHAIDVDVLPNRSSDCLSHRGIAKELSVILNTLLKSDPLQKERLLSPQSKLFQVEVEDTTLCRRFSAAVLRGITVGPSPKWLTDYLEALGQKSINNVVDAANYVMFDLGQPLHAFDMDRLSDKDGYKIRVRNAKEKESITTLTGETYELTKNDLLITDGNSNTPIGIAGIKGGLEAEIKNTTKNVIIECANFDPTSVRRSSQYLKLRTDASARFENEPAIKLTEYAVTDVVKLILDIAGGELEGYVDFFPRKQHSYKVGVSVNEINQLLGTDITKKEVEDILRQFGFSYATVQPVDTVLHLAPSYVDTPYKYFSSLSYDGTTTFDCSSYIRHLFIEGGVGIPRVSIDQYVYGEEVEDIQPGDVVFSVGSDKSRTHHKTVMYMPGVEVPVGVSHCGLYVGEGKVAHASGKDSRGKVIIEALKDSPDFTQIVGYRRMIANNDERYVVTVPFERLDLRITEDLIEEIGRIYGYKNVASQVPDRKATPPRVNKRFYYTEKIRAFLAKRGFTEVYTYTFRDHGEMELANALASDKNWLRDNLREGIETSLTFNAHYIDLLGLESICIFEFGTVFAKEGEHISFSLGMYVSGSKQTKQDEEVTELISILEKELEVSVTGNVENGVFEANFSRVLEELVQPKTYDISFEHKKPTVFTPISPYPFVLRDIAVWVPYAVKKEKVLAIIEKEAGVLFVRSTLFDEYKKDGRISYAFRLVFLSHEKTLTDDEINEIMHSITSALNANRGFEVR